MTASATEKPFRATSVPIRSREGSLSALDSTHGRTTIADRVVAKITGITAREVVGINALGFGAARTISALRDRLPGSGTTVAQGISVVVGAEEAAVDLDGGRRHCAARGTSTPGLPVRGPQGERAARAPTVIRAAGEVSAPCPGVRSAPGRTRTDRHHLAQLDAVTDPRVDLAAAADAAARTAGGVLDPTAVAASHGRGRLTVGGRDTRARRGRT